MPWDRVIRVWLVIIASESMLGTLRTLYLAPRIGEVNARQIGVVVAIAVTLAIATAFSRWIGPRTKLAWMAVGLVWAGLTVVFEFILGRALGLSWQRLLADYDPTQGGLMLVGLIGVIYCPRIAARIRGTLI
jgi:hypothetical protein